MPVYDVINVVVVFVLFYIGVIFIFVKINPVLFHFFICLILGLLIFLHVYTLSLADIDLAFLSIRVFSFLPITYRYLYFIDHTIISLLFPFFHSVRVFSHFHWDYWWGLITRNDCLVHIYFRFISLLAYVINDFLKWLFTIIKNHCHLYSFVYLYIA